MNDLKLTKEYVLDEVNKLQYLYKLKNVIRYAQIRELEDSTESVAEHVYGMNILATYFLALLDKEGRWDKIRIYEMITFHDIDEIETGDVIDYTKTEAARNNEAEMMRKVIQAAPNHMRQIMLSIIDEYEEQQTIESRFVKAIDKFEPLIHIYNEKGKKILQNIKTTARQSSSIKEPHLQEFPVMFQYYQIIHQAMIDENFFH